MRSLSPVRTLFFLLGLLFLMACSDSDAPTTTASKTSTQATVAEQTESEAYIEQGDIEALNAGNKNERAISGVVSPPSVRRVSATWESRASAG